MTLRESQRIDAQSAKCLVELVGDDGVLDEEFEGNDLQRVLVRGFEDDRASGAGLLDLEPARGTHAPAVAGFQAGKTVLRHGHAEVVAESFRRREERSIDDAADGVDTVVVGTGLATAGAVKAGHRFAAADVEWLAKHVLAAILDGFDGGHQAPLNVSIPLLREERRFEQEDSVHETQMR
jgi:hypothetical protein